MALVNQDAAKIIEEKDLTPERLIAVVDSLTQDKSALRTLGENAKKMAVMDSAAVICDLLTELE